MIKTSIDRVKDRTRIWSDFGQMFNFLRDKHVSGSLRTVVVATTFKTKLEKS